jgi:kinesin family protein 3/17
MREKDSSLPFRSIASVSEDKSTISLIEYLGFEFEEALKQKELIDSPNHFLPHPYTFDHIFDMDSTQEEVYQIAAVPAVESLVEGYNSTIFAYGQTGTGKTYTMEGFIYDYLSPKKGLIPRAIEDIFKYIENNLNSDTTFIIRVTYLQIYNESIDDLLKPEKKHLSIRENQKKGLYVEGLSEWAVRSPNDIYALLERGAQCRTKAYTNMNDVSSRSHAVFTIILEQMKICNGKKRFKTGKLNMVDLAGSERVKISGATGKQLDESRRINKSLSALGNVINALTDPKTKHIPYRDSKLTRLLQNSLGGNCKTSMIAMISPYDGSYNESISTLNFAKRAKSIIIKASVNEEVNQNALISQYEKELSRLRQELNEKNEIINSNAFIKKIEMEKLQAEKDKNEALQALEKASLRFLQEREEKRKLEKKIEIMNFQMIPGGQKVKIEDTPEFKTLLQKHQILLEKDFNEKLNDLEKEKELIQISKEQVDSYNHLLHKQRETMDNLTNNLKEKEENITHLNEMIDSYEKIINEQDNIIEIKNQRIKLLENILIKNKVEFPKDTLLSQNISCNAKLHNLRNKVIVQDLNLTDTTKKNNSINNNNNIEDNFNNDNNDINFGDNISNINFSNENDSDKIIIKFSNIKENSNNKTTITEDKDKDKDKTKDIATQNNNNNNMKVKNDIINISEKNNKQYVKNKDNDISLEKNNLNDGEDEENFNVVMSGSISKTNIKKNKNIKNYKITKKN